MIIQCAILKNVLNAHGGGCSEDVNIRLRLTIMMVKGGPRWEVDSELKSGAEVLPGNLSSP